MARPRLRGIVRHAKIANFSVLFKTLGLKGFFVRSVFTKRMVHLNCQMFNSEILMHILMKYATVDSKI